MKMLHNLMPSIITTLSGAGYAVAQTTQPGMNLSTQTTISIALMVIIVGAVASVSTKLASMAKDIEYLRASKNHADQQRDKLWSEISRIQRSLPPDASGRSGNNNRGGG